MRASLALCVTALAIAACSSSSAPSSASPGATSTVVRASDYDQRCATADDCTPVVDGDLCPCACPNAAIRKIDEARYQADVRDRIGQCPNVYCGACDDVKPTCVAGRCAIIDCGPRCPDGGAD